MSKKTGVGACGRMSRGSAFCIRVRIALLLLFSVFGKDKSTFRFWLWSELIIVIIIECLSLSLSLFSPTTKNAHAQLNGSTRPKGSGSSSPTTGAKKSSCTNRTWKRRDSAVYERYVLIDPRRGLKWPYFFDIIYRAKRWNSTWTRPKGSGRKPSMWLGQKERTC